MQIFADTPDHYVEHLPADRQDAINQLRRAIRANLPDGFEETMSYGMIGYVIPHSLYPSGYHCDPKLPLPFMSVASQKNFVAVYHMAMPEGSELLNWFQEEYPKYVKGKLDMGKSCIRFKKVDQIPNELIGELAGKMDAATWIHLYETTIKRQ